MLQEHAIASGAVTAAALTAVRVWLQAHDPSIVVGDGEWVDQLRELEQLKAVCAGIQAEVTAAFVASQTADLTATQVRNGKVLQSVKAQVALARRDSPARGGRHVGLAKALTREMPHTFAALRTGQISEWRATVVVRETATLSVEDRRRVDLELAGRLPVMGDKQTAAAAAAIAYRLDANQAVERHRKALGDCRVNVRPAPDGMAYVTALVPLVHGVAVYASLNEFASSQKAFGDQRSRGQIMAYEFVCRAATRERIEALLSRPTGHSDTQPGRGKPAAAGVERVAPADPVVVRHVDVEPAAVPPADPAGVSRMDPAPPAPANPVLPTVESDDGLADAGTAAPASPALEADRACTTPTPLADTAFAATSVAVVSPIVVERVGKPDPAIEVATEGHPVVGEFREENAPEQHTPSSAAAVDARSAASTSIQLLVTDRTLFDGDAEPAVLTGFGPIAAPLARNLVRAVTGDSAASIRRVFADHRTGDLVGIDTRRRPFAQQLRRHLIASGSNAARNETPGLPPGFRLDIQLIITDRAEGTGGKPVPLQGLPEGIAAKLGPDGGPKANLWLWRLYTDRKPAGPVGDPNSRLFAGVTRSFVTARDQTCRSPWCDAPIRHIDHITPVAKGGSTTLTNAEGMCEACNYLKEALGWFTEVNADGVTTITTPTGRTYQSRPPRPPRSAPWATSPSILEQRLMELLGAAA